MTEKKFKTICVICGSKNLQYEPADIYDDGLNQDVDYGTR